IGEEVVSPRHIIFTLNPSAALHYVDAHHQVAARAISELREYGGKFVYGRFPGISPATYREIETGILTGSKRFGKHAKLFGLGFTDNDDYELDLINHDHSSSSIFRDHFGRFFKDTSGGASNGVGYVLWEVNPNRHSF